MSTYTVKPLDESTWPGFSRLVERHNGVWGGCWCMGFHPEGVGRGRTAEGNRAAKEGRVHAGTAHAALVFDGDECVGWCQFGPTGELPRIKSQRAYAAGLVELPDWRITCFFVDKGRRGTGVASAALGGALDEIARLGGGTVESYPEDVEGRSVSGSFLHNGTLALFEQHGFTPVRLIGKNRWVVTTDVQPSRPAWTHDAFVAVLDSSARRLLDVAASGDAETAVPACPGWTITDLVAHVGAIHRWATQVILTGNPADLPAVPDDLDVLLAWTREGASRLVDVLASADPRQPTWTFGPKPHVAAFWSRRQAHETTMHLWDAQDARGHEYRWDPRLAADGVDEVATVFFPRQVRLGRAQPLPGPVQLDVIDAPGVAITLAPLAADAPPSATLRGTAEDLLLALWGRRPLDVLEVSGDGAVIDALRGSAITP